MLTVDGMIVDRLAPAEADEARELLAYLGVLVIRGQPNRNIDDRAFIRFLRSLR